ncbi:MAG: DUF559 domain-containing protein [Dermatophilaceae bacterium]
MSRPRTTPLSPLGPAFTRSEGLAAGLPFGALRHPDFARPTRGLRLTDTLECVDAQAAAMAKVLEGEWAFSHVTAARLLRLPVPKRWMPRDPLHVMVPTEGCRPRRPGVAGHRGLESRSVTYANRWPVVRPAQTWADLAALDRQFGRPTIDDLVVVADAILAVNPALRSELVAEVATRKGARGIRALREALTLARTGSASAMESRARLRFVRAGLPEPELNQDVYDEAGAWLGRVDMLWRDHRTIVEYEGDQHRSDRQQWQSDIVRVRRLEAAGWRVIRMSAEDLIDPGRWAQLVTLLRRLLAV